MLVKHFHLEELGMRSLSQFLQKKDTHTADPAVKWFLAQMPKHWLNIDQDGIPSEETLEFGVIEKKWTVKQIYQFLMEYVNYTPTTIQLWWKRPQFKHYPRKVEKQLQTTFKNSGCSIEILCA